MTQSHGSPYCYHDPVIKQPVIAPEHRGNGTGVGRCANRELPIADYPAHWAPHFHTG
jgi:hypothetical protein